MPRPTNKGDLLIAAEEEFTKLWALIDKISEEEQHATFLFEDRDKNLRDVLVHLYEWYQMVNHWHQIGTIEGGMPAVPGEDYNWRTLPALNLEIWKKYQDISLEASKEMLRESHEMIIDLIEPHTNEELFSKSIYPWTKSSTLGAYFISSTSSHYVWAMKKIRKHIKTRKQAEKEMKSLNASIRKYGSQVEKGDIKFAYQGLINYLMKLKTYFKNQYPEYNVAGNFYQGYMDMSFFSLSPEKFKEKHLKIAVVFIHKNTNFEVWLTGKNSAIQTEYRKIFRETGSNQYTVSPDKKGVTSIVESVLIEDPNFDNLKELTDQIDSELKDFIADMEKLLK